MPTSSSAWPRASRRAAPGRRPRHGAGNGQRHGARLLQQVRLPGLRLFAAGAGAAPVLVQQPDGRLPGCDGLGHIEFFDPKRIVAFPNLSLASGAVKGWDRRNQFYFQMLSNLAAFYEFDLDLPFEKLPKSRRSGAVRLGQAADPVHLRQRARPHRGQGAHVRRRGQQPARRYRETDSMAVRKNWPSSSTRRSARRATARACAGSALRQGRQRQAKAIYEIAEKPLRETLSFFEQLKLNGAKKEIADRVVKEIISRLQFLNNVGLDYLSLDRSADTLSGGEAQRIRLASQIGSGLTGVMYVLDEPSIGLHQRDNDRLIDTLKHLRDIGNSVLVVEHDEDAIRTADYIVDMGPGAGVHGGDVIAAGTLKDILKNKKSLTAQYLSGTQNRRAEEAPRGRSGQAAGHHRRHRQQPEERRPAAGRPADLRDRRVRLRQVDADQRHAVPGAVAPPVRFANRAGAARRISGLEHFDKVISVDQAPIGRTPRSNPATYTGLFTPIRELFATVPTAKERGYSAGRFSFNVKGGRCEACQGDGVIKVEMHFLPDVYVPCDVCHGKRYNRETLEVQYKGKNITEMLDMTVEDAHEFFKPVPLIARKLQTLLDVGLGYIKLGQSATTLSGGEAQRVKLSLELSKRDTGRTLYILDEPTTGLHFHDIDLLLKVIHRLRDQGNTLVIIEHNLDVIKTADWIVDLGPKAARAAARSSPPARRKKWRPMRPASPANTWCRC
jgi:excinuclease ABC subunit A